VRAVEGDCYGDAGALNANGIDLTTDFYNITQRLLAEVRFVWSRSLSLSLCLSLSLSLSDQVEMLPFFFCFLLIDSWLLISFLSLSTPLPPVPLTRTQDKTLQPETRAVVNWINQTAFALSLSLRAGTLVAAYPFFSAPVSTRLTGQGAWSGEACWLI
jgi:hypothetical protein